MFSGENMFQRFRSRNDPQAKIRSLYGAIVAQAREPCFYGDYGVPDTVEGRFDMMVLHVYLVSRRLMADGQESAPAQEVFDLFFQDMDENMRELGVGDLSVPKKVRAMGEAFYGRAGAYNAALADGGDEKLVSALDRNVFGGAGNTQAARQLARYVRAADRALFAQSPSEIARGEVVFPVPEEIAS
jgi:cytochrome b pre-mRNA-processing protein 3